MQRFYLSDTTFSSSLTITDEHLLHQLQRVLRIKIGQEVLFFSHNTQDALYRLESTNAKMAQFVFVEYQNNAAHPKRELTIVQALPNKLEKIEWILQKGVEIGVTHFVFFRSDHSQELPQLTKKLPRLLLIIQEALEQCGGNILPTLEILSSAPQTEMNDIILDPLGNKTFIEGVWETASQKTIRFWVGPEGGWSEKERNNFADKWAISCSFGNRILRTETASISAAFYILSTI